MAIYRVCKSFTVESGHMLSRHPESCRFPHGHTRTIEVVVRGERLDENDMLVDFKALKLAFSDYIDQFDHAMAVNSSDPFLAQILDRFPAESVVVFENAEPTTEKMAERLFDFGTNILRDGFRSGPYEIPAGRVQLERVRVWETPSSWAECGL